VPVVSAHYKPTAHSTPCRLRAALPAEGNTETTRYRQSGKGKARQSKLFTPRPPRSGSREFAELLAGRL
jgi:hypothetical protein